MPSAVPPIQLEPPLRSSCISSTSLACASEYLLYIHTVVYSGMIIMFVHGDYLEPRSSGLAILSKNGRVPYVYAHTQFNMGTGCLSYAHVPTCTK